MFEVDFSNAGHRAAVVDGLYKLLDTQEDADVLARICAAVAKVLNLNAMLSHRESCNLAESIRPYEEA